MRSEHLRLVASDTRGNVAIVVAAAMTGLLGVAALAVDLGLLFIERRGAQRATDLAAIAAASDLPNALAAATATVSDNGVTPLVPLTVQTGLYTPAASVQSASRFRAARLSESNAAKVTLKKETRLRLARILTGQEVYTITTEATAANTAMTSFSIGSRIARIDGGLANQLLGALLGVNLSLSAMDYQAIVDAKVDMFGVLKEAGQSRLTGLTYSSLLAGSLPVGELLSAVATVAQASPSVPSRSRTALDLLARTTRGLTNAVPLASLVNLGAYGDTPLAASAPQPVLVSAWDLIAASAALANGRNQVAVDLDLGLPGIAKSSLTLAVGEPPVGASRAAVGAEGASVRTAQTRLSLAVETPASGPLPRLTLPVVVEVAGGAARVDRVGCGVPDVASSTVTLGVTTGVADAWIGNVSAQALTEFGPQFRPEMATLAQVGGTSVRGRAHAAIGSTTPKTVVFSYGDIQRGTTKTVSTTSYVPSLVGSLVGDLALEAKIGNVEVGVPPLIGRGLSDTLATLATPLDDVLIQLLTMLGAQLGQADVWATSLRCDGAVLVR